MQVVDLQYAPNGIEPVIRVSQFDTGRQFQLRIFDGVTPYVMPEGTVARIDGIKPDKTGFSYIDAVSVEDNIVTVTTQDQMTVLSGIVECEIRFIQGTNYIGTLNFKLNVEKSPINGDTDMSETDIPAIVELARIQEVNSEAWATGKKNGVDVPSTEPMYHNNSKYYAEQAEEAASSIGQLAEDAEAWAVGERGGTPVTSGDETYQNNAKYYAGNASTSSRNAAISETNAAESAEDAEASATSASTNAANAATSATSASNSASAAAQSEEDSEAWAVGTRNGVAVQSTDPAYHNNAKYYADEAGGAVNDMQGATSSADGAHGLAPQPLAGDNEKFLKGDGTWAGVPTELRGLEDVDLTNIADGQLLRYNGTAQKWENIGVDSTPTQNSANPIQSGAVYTALTNKQATYAGDATQWDSTPTANSTKPVTSGGIKTQLDAVANELTDITNILGAKNILPNGASTVTTNGITFTVNANGTVKATGTATADATLVLSSSFYVGNGRKVILSGCPSGGSTSKYFMYLTDANGNTSKGNDVGSGITITADADNLGCKIIVKKNQALGTTGIIFSPMVRPANTRDSSYVPYAMTNKQLTREMYKSNFTSQGGGSFSGSTTWTVPEDGLYALILQTTSGFEHDAIIAVGGVWVAHDYFNAQYRCLNAVIPLKKGVVVKFELTGNASGTWMRTRMSS